MSRPVAATAIGLGLVFLAGPANAVLYDRCEGAIAERIAELGVQSAEVVGVRYFPRIERRRTAAVVRGAKAFVNLSTCQGSLVIETREDCRIQRTYTRGACSFRTPTAKARTNPACPRAS